MKFDNVTTNQLLDVWNSHAEKVGKKPVKKFSTKADGIKRITRLLSDLKALDPSAHKSALSAFSEASEPISSPSKGTKADKGKQAQEAPKKTGKARKPKKEKIPAETLFKGPEKKIWKLYPANPRRIETRGWFAWDATRNGMTYPQYQEAVGKRFKEAGLERLDDVYRYVYGEYCRGRIFVGTKEEFEAAKKNYNPEEA